MPSEVCDILDNLTWAPLQMTHTLQTEPHTSCKALSIHSEADSGQEHITPETCDWLSYMSVVSWDTAGTDSMLIVQNPTGLLFHHLSPVHSWDQALCVLIYTHILRIWCQISISSSIRLSTVDLHVLQTHSFNCEFYAQLVYRWYDYVTSVW